MEKWEYIKVHIYWGFLVFIWGRALIFRCIPNYTEKGSLYILAIIGMIVLGSGINFTWNRGRNYSSLAQNIILPWGAFAVLAYMDLFQKKIMILAIVTAVISIFLTVLVFCQKIKRNNKKKVIRNRVRMVLAMWRRNLTVASLFLLIPIGYSMMQHGVVLNGTEESTMFYGEEDSLEANIDVICNINPQRWEKLELKEKLYVCQKIVNAEAEYLGISHEIAITTETLSGKTMAYYNEARHQIAVDPKYLNDSDKVCEIFLHEVYHAYEFKLAAIYQRLDEKSRNLLLFQEAAIYLDEFKNYKSESEDFDLYYNQLVEINARKAAKERAKVYIARINEYLNE